MKKGSNRINPLPILAAIVVIAAAAVTLIMKNNQYENNQYENSQYEEPPTAESQPSENIADMIIPTGEVGTDASWFDYNANGVTVQLLAVRASDGTIRLALNTCQVCNGSPYAYFEQDGDWFICQNCGNRFASAEIGIVNGGCRPVPITEEIYTEQAGTITIPAAYLEENADLFRNWKNF